jgi:hypothetical protein
MQKIKLGVKIIDRYGENGCIIGKSYAAEYLNPIVVVAFNNKHQHYFASSTTVENLCKVISEFEPCNNIHKYKGKCIVILYDSEVKTFKFLDEGMKCRR